MSKGMQQKVQFIAALLHEPELIIMDEPFAGLDPVNANQLKDVLLELKEQGRTIMFSTHRMDQVEKLCDTICLVNHGRIVLQGACATSRPATDAASCKLSMRAMEDFWPTAR